MSRISRDRMFMEIAEVVAKRGTCDRAQVGAVLVSEGRVICIGYNGSKPGEPHCDDVGHLIENGHCIRTTHAEVNCINFANHFLNHHHMDPIECTLYVTHLPCENCCKFIAMNNNDGTEMIDIKRVVYREDYGYVELGDLIDRADILDEGGATLEQFKL